MKQSIRLKLDLLYTKYFLKKIIFTPSTQFNSLKENRTYTVFSRTSLILCLLCQLWAVLILPAVLIVDGNSPFAIELVNIESNEAENEKEENKSEKEYKILNILKGKNHPNTHAFSNLVPIRSSMTTTYLEIHTPPPEQGSNLA